MRIENIESRIKDLLMRVRRIEQILTENKMHFTKKEAKELEKLLEMFEGGDE